MPWSWELSDWPHFTYNPDQISQKEKEFLLKIGGASAFLKNIEDRDSEEFIVELLSTEGIESSRIEGEILDRESMQSSIRKNLGLETHFRKGREKESNIAKLLCDVYRTFDKPLTHEMLWQWHAHL